MNKTLINLSRAFAVACGLSGCVSAGMASQAGPNKQQTLHVKKTMSGIASWYGNDLRGSKMANGKRFNPSAPTVAHKTLPLGSCVEVEVPRTGRKAEAVVTDRGPYVQGRIVDVSARIADELGIKSSGLAHVSLSTIPCPPELSRP